jgi:hypothetical protein
MGIPRADAGTGSPSRDATDCPKFVKLDALFSNLPSRDHLKGAEMPRSNKTIRLILSLILTSLAKS